MKIGFIGLGNMGGPMAANLLKAGYGVAGFDLAAPLLEALAKAGSSVAASAGAAVAEAEIVITMLPGGPAGAPGLCGEGGVLAAARKGALLIDCSTIDVESARSVDKGARRAFRLRHARRAGLGRRRRGRGRTLTFMVGGNEDRFARGKPILERMGKRIVHCWPGRQRSSRENLQQHDPRRIDDCG